MWPTSATFPEWCGTAVAAYVTRHRSARAGGALSGNSGTKPAGTNGRGDVAGVRDALCDGVHNPALHPDEPGGGDRRGAD